MESPVRRFVTSISVRTNGDGGVDGKFSSIIPLVLLSADKISPVDEWNLIVVCRDGTLPLS